MFSYIPYLKQHDIIVKHPVIVLVVFDDQWDVEYLLKSLHSYNVVLTQNHFYRVTPTKKQNVKQNIFKGLFCLPLMRQLIIYSKVIYSPPWITTLTWWMGHLPEGHPTQIGPGGWVRRSAIQSTLMEEVSPRAWCPFPRLGSLEPHPGARSGGGAHRWAPGGCAFTHGVWPGSA